MPNRQEPATVGRNRPSSEELRRQPHLAVYDSYFILVGDGDAAKRTWFEGTQSREAQERYQRITEALKRGFLDDMIGKAGSPEQTGGMEEKLTDAQREKLSDVVGAITSEVGRALVQIFVLQLVVKTIAPEQDVRLHKGRRASRGFSWQEGISMRTLDSSFVAPTLRKHELLGMNTYGAFMTRSFAENYPYTRFYKAEIRGQGGAKKRWVELLDDLEEGRLDPEAALLHVLVLLQKRSAAFAKAVDALLHEVDRWAGRRQPISISRVAQVIKRHIDSSEGKARLLEVAMHALLQGIEDAGVELPGELEPLMPMRTANRKHRNVGDIEITFQDGPVAAVIEAWDAKYGITYLSDALDDLRDKLRQRDASGLEFGFVLYPQKLDYLDDDLLPYVVGALSASGLYFRSLDNLFTKR